MVASVCLGLSAIALGQALQVNNGFYDMTALRWLTASLLLPGVGVAALRSRRLAARPGEAVVMAVVGAGVGWQLVQLYSAPPGFSTSDAANFTLFKQLIVAEGLVIALGVGVEIWTRLRGTRLPGRWDRVWFPAVLAINVALGVWIIRASPDPPIDVVIVHHEAIDALLKHTDPYRISFENIYGDDAKNFYNPAAIVGRRVAFAYPYPPVSLLFAIPGHVLAHDFRYSDLAALIVAAALVAFIGPGIAPKLAACLFLTTPRILFVLEQGWTEPISVLVLAATVFLLFRTPMAGGWAAGILIVTKQYLAIAALPFLRFAIGQRGWRTASMLTAAAFTAAAATLPFALWHPHAFLNNVVWLQGNEPFRSDSLSYLSWAARAGWGEGSLRWAVAAASIAAAAGIVMTPNTAAGFGASVALYSLAMFTFGSKAFCNYYFFVIGALCCTLAVTVAKGVDRRQLTVDREETATLQNC
jgi:hypothetical protein